MTAPGSPDGKVSGGELSCDREDGPLFLAFVICTYNRPDLLVRTVRSCLGQTNRSAVTYEVVVVDNSDDGSARGLVEGLAATATVPLRYVQAHPPNISVARNRGIAATASRYVAFCDDDEAIGPDWLDVVAAAIQRYDADGYFGARVPVIADLAPEPYGATEPTHQRPTPAPPADPGRVNLAWALKVYSRDLGRPTGTPIVMFGRGKARAMVVGTANSVMKRATCLTDPDPFDLTFGDCGGEDYELFCRLERRGCRFVWCAEAVSREIVPASRLDADYLALRMFSGAQVFVAAIVKNSPHPRLTEANLVARGLLQSVFWGCAYLLCRLVAPQRSRSVRPRVMLGLGKVIWRSKLRLYRLEERGEAQPSFALLTGRRRGP